MTADERVPHLSRMDHRRLAPDRPTPSTADDGGNA
jgi:hypothetical protein